MIQKQLLLALSTLILPMAVFAVQQAPAQKAEQPHLQCETFSENNMLCLGGGAQDSETAVKPAGSGQTKTSGLATRDDLSGGAIDMDNEFALATVLGDRTSVPEDSRFSALAAGQKAENQIRNIDVLLQSSYAASGAGKITTAGKK